MKFYDREKEVSFLRDVRQKSEKNARFTVITGRRRVGKTQLVQYAMKDRPYLFWFRFIFKYQNLVELGRFDQLQELVRRDVDAFSGYALERYFHWKFAEGTAYTKMDAWWDRKGENEIDLVCEDEMAGTLDFFEIKREAARIDLSALKRKTTAFFEKNPTCLDLKIAVRGLSLSDM